MTSLRLYKKEKLCSTVAISMLFGHGAAVSSALAFPVRAVWRNNPGRHSDAPLQFLVSVPKRKLRHAVDRVTMRRRIREAFRLLHQSFPLPPGTRIDVAFIYVDNKLQPWSRVEKSMRRLLEAVMNSVAPALEKAPGAGKAENPSEAPYER